MSIKLNKVFLLVTLTLSACQTTGEVINPSSTVREESQFTLNNATLEQSNAKGETVWKVQADKAQYTPDRKKAILQKIRGNLFQDKKLVLQVTAEKGEVGEQGEDISLQGNVIAKDPRNGIVMRTSIIEWLPEKDLVQMPKQVKGNHPKLTVLANQGRYFTRRQRLELIGKIVADSKDPRLQLKTERLAWNIPQQLINGDRRLAIVRYEDEKVTDRLITNRSDVDLKNNIVVIQENIDFKSIDPPIQIVSNIIRWNYKTRIVTSEKPVRLLHYQDNVEIAGNQAMVNLRQKVAYLSGGIEGDSTNNQAKLYAENLTWNIDAKVVEAVGNVTYHQLKSPQFHLTGERAVGRLQDKSIVVTKGSREQVVTNIVPE